MTKAFQDTKEALAKATLLAHPCQNAPISLTTDASDLAVGAVLQQSVNGCLVPLAFFSQKLRTPERKYSTFDRELLALYLGIRRFLYFLEGRQFTAFTDHKPLTFSMSKTSDPWSSRQQRQLSYISEFTTDIRHVPGKDNPVTDTVKSYYSRSTVGDRLLFHGNCPATGSRSTCTTPSSLRLEDVPFGTQGVRLLCDTSTGHPRPIVPVSLRRQVFDLMHCLSHPSVRTTRKLIATRFVWKGLQKQIGIWAKQCIACQASKIFKSTSRPPLKSSVFPGAILITSMSIWWDRYRLPADLLTCSQ